MTELYSTSIDSSQPATETDTGHEPARDNAAGQYQDNAAIEASLDEAELPTRAESRTATWGPDTTDQDDEPDFGPEPDNAAIEASLDEADLPTRAESRTATWGPDTTDGDEEQLAAEDRSDQSAIAARPERPEQHDSAGADLGAGQNADASSSEGTSIKGEQATETRSGTEPLTGRPRELGAADAHDASQATDVLSAQASTDDHHQDAADNWPSQQDRARLHGLYQEYLKDAAASQEIGRDSGTNVVGDKPDRSPGDTSDLPPTGEQLAEMEGDKKSRFQGLWHEAEKEDALDGIHTELEADANTLHDWLAARPPEGHAEQPVPVSPGIGPQVADHAIDAGNAATACLALGFVMVELGRRIHDRLNHRKGNVNAGD